MAELTVTRYLFPNTGDKRDDETWVSYWGRKRYEAYVDSCSCLPWRNVEGLTPYGKRGRDFLAVEKEETDPGDGLLPTRQAT
jgi:hypothetical protein